MNRIDEHFTEDNLDNFVHHFVKQGMQVVDVKTKLAKRVYLLILIFNSVLLLLSFLQVQIPSFKNAIQSFLSDYLLFIVLTLVVLFALVIIFPERNNNTRYYVLPIWVFFVLLIAAVLSQLLVWKDNLPFFYLIMTLHHLAMTVIVVFSQKYTMMV